jgi:hypothetical protein
MAVRCTSVEKEVRCHTSILPCVDTLWKVVHVLEVLGFNQNTNDVNKVIVFQSAVQVFDQVSRQIIYQEAENVYVNIFKETGKALTTGDIVRASDSAGSTSS